MTMVGIIQMQSQPCEVDSNLARAEALVKKSTQQGAELVVLPEWFSVGYSYSEEMMSVAEDIEDGKTVAWLQRTAKQEGIYILTSIYEVENGRFFNTMVLAQPDGNIQSYRKRNPFWQEYALYEPGSDPGPGIFDTDIGRIGGVVCFDAFARETYQNLKANDVDVLAVVACWGTPDLMPGHSELKSAKSMLKSLGYQATEELPKRYAEELQVPVIHVGQGGLSDTSIPYPKYWPYKSIARNQGYFWGHSNITRADGTACKEFVENENESEFAFVVDVEINKKPHKGNIVKKPINASYLSSRHYFVKLKPFVSKIMQQWCALGFRGEYDRRRANINPDSAIT